MKHLLKHLLPFPRAAAATTSLRLFSSINNNNSGSGINPGHPYNVNEVAHTDEATKQRILAREKQAFESLSEKEKLHYQAFRLSLIKSMEESWKDKNNWWNKVATMTDEEIETLPNEYIRKFGSFIFRVQEVQKVAHTEVNQQLNGMYQEIKTMEKLLTNEEKEAEKELKERAIAADSKWRYELTGYMKRQPRLDIEKQVGNYNYEQFREYTALYERAKKRDNEEQR